MPGREARSPGCPLARAGHRAAAAASAQVRAKPRDCWNKGDFSSTCNFWTAGGGGIFFFQRRENVMKHPPTPAGPTPGSAAAAQRSSSRHEARRGWRDPSLPASSLAAPRHRRSSARAGTEPGKAINNHKPAPAVGNPGTGLMPVQQRGCTAQGCCSWSPWPMHENILGCLWEFQGFRLLLHERSGHASPRTGRGTGDAPRPCISSQSQRERARIPGRSQEDPALPCGPWPGGSKTPGLRRWPPRAHDVPPRRRLNYQHSGPVCPQIL